VSANPNPATSGTVTVIDTSRGVAGPRAFDRAGAVAGDPVMRARLASL
jgi:hypothetical protein